MKRKTPLQAVAVLLLVALPLMWLAACGANHQTDVASAPATDQRYEGSDKGWGITPEQPAPPMPEERQSMQQQQGQPPAPPQLARANTFTIQPGEEVWIIAKPTRVVEDNVERAPGSGALIAVAPLNGASDREDTPRDIPLPLKHTDVKASVAGYIATVDVTQQFHNPYSSKIEAVYQFPLPQDAAVSEFVMEVGPPNARRRIRGIIRDKQQAQRIYEHAKRQGHNAALLEQVRPNIFEQKVANIEPGKQIDIQIRYFNTLQYRDGWYEFVFPMVVGPRYNPAYSNDPVHAVSQGAWRAREGRRADLSRPAQGTTVSYLRPNERSGHDISLSLDIDAGVSIEEAQCVTHRVEVQPDRNDPDRMRLRLAPDHTIPNKDFVFRYRVAGDTLKTGLVKHVDDRGRGYFSLMLIPPAELIDLQRQPMEMIFVVDCSGSMKGDPMRQCKEAMHHALSQLGPDDTFQIIRFSEDASALGRRPLPVTRENFRKARRYIDRLSGTGGTEMLAGIKAALDMPRDRQRYRVVTFMTDGKISNEDQVLSEMSRRMGDARVFSFGVGSSVNRFLMERMAKAGRGAAAYLLPEDSGEEVMRLYFDRVSRPAMTDLQIDYNTPVADVYPRTMPDVFVGRPVIVTGRYTGDLRDIRIAGRAGQQALTRRLDARDSAAHPALGRVWARRKIMGLMDTMRTERRDHLQREVRRTALEYNLVSAYTSFIAVDAARYTAGRRGTTVHQAVPVPEGVEYDTTVRE